MSGDHQHCNRCGDDMCERVGGNAQCKKPAYEPRYSGPGKSGICKCGHPWQEHHLCMVARQEYVDQTGEEYIPCECEHYGCNELGGLAPNGKGEWEPHCFGYVDAGEVSQDAPVSGDGKQDKQEND